MTTPGTEPEVNEEENLEEPAPQLSISSTSDSDILLASDAKPRRPHKYRRVKKKKLPPVVPKEVNDIKGVRKLTLSFNTQKAIQCIVGETITSEYPWKYIEKMVLQENLELHEVSSEFLPIAQEIVAFPKNEILLVYIPDEQTEVHEFYVCLSEAAEIEVYGIIDNALKAREEKLQNSVVKTARKWKSQGSERDIKRMREKIHRPFLEVELEAEYPVFVGKTKFKLRLTQHAQDGYLELLSLRQKFDTIQRKQIDVAVQVNLPLRESYAQTVCVYPKNIGTQYYFEFPPLVKLTKQFYKNYNYFLQYELDWVSEMLTINSTLNYYRNDYSTLVRDTRFTQAGNQAEAKYFTSIADPKICGKKEVACQDWHPMWSGTMAIAYSDHSNYEYVKYNPIADDVLSAIYDVTPVYLWTFQDFIEPRLLLETHREVVALRWCPYDENILVGGCVNGQIIVWDITDRLRQVEEPELLNSKQMQYRLLMHSLMSWMRNTLDPKYVRSTVISDIAHSQRAEITKIKWLSPYREITKRGKLVAIPEEEGRSSLQFITTSRDGTIAYWDLNATVAGSGSGGRPQRKLRRLKKRPSPLTVQVSPFRPLNRLLKPTYKLNVVLPKSDRILPITSIFFDVARTTYVEKNPEENVNVPYDITRRVYYTPVLHRDEHPASQEMLLATGEGDFITGTWEGFDYNTGNVVNKEDVNFTSLSKYHDGPILSLSVSTLFPELVLTVGGNTYCLWLLSHKDYPAFWKRSAYKYTHGRWTTKRPSIFRLSRQDGNMEFWHLKTRTDKYIDLEYISSRGLGYSSTHPRPLDRLIMGIVEGKGYYELIQIPLGRELTDEEENKSTYMLCQREIARKKKLAQWQQWWLTKNADLVNEIRAEQHRLRLEKEEKAKLEKAQQQEQEEQIEEETKAPTGKDQYKDYGEWAHAKMMQKEKERQLKLSMAKKDLDMELLLKQQQPLLDIQKELEEKEKKQQKRLERGTEFFDIAVARMFPEVLLEKPPSVPDPYAGGDSPEVRQAIFNDYKEIEQTCSKIVDKQRFEYKFSWIRALDNGKERRKLLNGFYDRTLSHKARFAQDRGGMTAVERTASSVLDETQEGEQNEEMIEDLPYL